jgi:hypothetical protein
MFSKRINRRGTSERLYRKCPIYAENSEKFACRFLENLCAAPEGYWRTLIVRNSADLKNKRICPDRSYGLFLICR